ncbi:type 2 lantibiotic biosynthesis protein LanM [Thermosporothrix hazakensis]|uniref:Type 2 lantibiotic biosynthesis protein LanM n=2 Tax=Thermosporothrix hazakensis TaxID=644383 RepID=A0A326U6S6_THEHA|nr:type 2 lantibiotic biosynthesis protein LanM [Thermosporothrix hazakensis]
MFYRHPNLFVHRDVWQGNFPLSCTAERREYMQESISKRQLSKYPVWQHASWYAAISLKERVALQNMSNGAIEQSHFEMGMAQSRLDEWKEQAPFRHDTELFLRRLALDGLTEQELLTMLAEPAHSLQTRVGVRPEWVERLRSAFEARDQADDTLELTFLEEFLKNQALLSPMKPLLVQALVRLSKGIHALSQRYTVVPFELKTICVPLLSQLPGRLLPRFLKTFVLELNVARLEEKLTGETSEERFQDFVRQLCEPGRMLLLLEEYNVLARLLVEALDQWVETSLELLERLCADWAEICATFAVPTTPGALVDIQTGKGDTHRGGRSVTVLTWSSGFQLVYKPRSLAVDVHFQELLAWLNEAGFQPAFRTLRILDRKSYGWMEFVRCQSCTLEEEVERFYRRQGGYLALLYALEAADFHFENLIAAGEHPILIDLEALFQPRLSMQAVVEQGFIDPECIDRSVLRIGLLPYRMWSSEQATGVDISGLGGQAGQVVPTMIPKWAEVGTDQMRLRKEQGRLAAGQHRPKLGEQDVDTLSYQDAILEGFTTVYRILMERREELLERLLPSFENAEIRCVLRPTFLYGVLLIDSFHPDVLRDALERDRLFDRLWIGVHQRPALEQVIAFERADLWRGDIPVFTTTPGSCTLASSSGGCIEHFFAEPTLTATRRVIQNLNKNDLERQCWIIRASFATMALGSDRPKRRAMLSTSARVSSTPERLLAEARRAGDRLNELVFLNKGAVSWLGVTPISDREWHVLPADLDLYGGVAGITLFLAYLGAVSGEERYTTLARQGQESLTSRLKWLKERPAALGVGPFGGNGVSGCIYLLSHLGALWNEPKLYREAEALADLLPEMVEHDELYDIIGGAAGGIGALLSLYAVAPSEKILSLACLCADHLLSKARTMRRGVGWSAQEEQVPLAGFAHGNAGIAWALLRLYALTREERFQRMALQAIAYERFVFSETRQNWPDLRGHSASIFDQALERSCSFMIAWCHGASGIGLGRLDTLDVLDDAETRAEIECALRTTLENGFGFNHSICHGDIGNLEFLRAAVKRFPSYAERVREVEERVLGSLVEQNFVSGLPNGVETPGLMVGVAGSGYGLLRLAAPELVPSVLLLAPPRVL